MVDAQNVELLLILGNCYPQNSELPMHLGATLHTCWNHLSSGREDACIHAGDVRDIDRDTSYWVSADFEYTA